MKILSRLFLDPKVRREKIKNEHKQALQREYADRYQIMEFGGREFLSVNGKPVVEAQLLKGDVVSAVKAAREATVEFLMDR